MVQVFTETEGLAPQDIEQYVTYPIEAVMNGLPKLALIRSLSNFGLSVVNVYFEDEVDIYFARQLVNERLQEARERIPEGFGEPKLGPISTGMGLVLLYYLDDASGQYSLTELRTIQDWLVKFHLQTVPGVTEVLGIGGYEKQYQISVHPELLVRYDVSIGDVIASIRANNLNVGAQFIEKNAEEFIVRSVGLVSSVEDIENVLIKTKDGTPVFLAELAEVQVGGAIRRGLHTRNGIQEVVAGTVVKLFGTNSSTVIERVEEKMAEINRILPEGISLIPYYEQKTLVAACVATVTNALVQGIGLVVVVLMLFMGGLRPSLVVALAIPFSVLFATLWMGYFNISANLMSLGGLAIAIGMLVDGTIVIVENVDRQLREADPLALKFDLVTRACSEVVRPILFAIVIIVIVFLPLFLLQGTEGKTFRPLAYTVALAMGGSLVFALLLAPVLAATLMRRPRQASATSASSQGIIVRALIAAYRPVVSLFVRYPLIALFVALSLVGSGSLPFPLLGSEFTPRLQEGTIVLPLNDGPVNFSTRE